jgi:hypothetical protein
MLSFSFRTWKVTQILQLKKYFFRMFLECFLECFHSHLELEKWPKAWNFRGNSAIDKVEDYFLWGCVVTEVEVDVLTGEKKVTPGANPTIASYSVSVVKIYIATSSLLSFENKNIFF